MSIIYRLKMSANGLNYIEDRDIEVLQGIRTNAGKTPEEWPIVPLDLKFSITNDPDLREFDDHDQAQEVCSNLAMDTFQVTFTKTLIDPPPEGFTG